MARLPAVYVFNKRQLGILLPGKILYPFYLNIRDWLCFWRQPQIRHHFFSVWNWFINWHLSWELGLILGGWYLSGGLWYRGFGNLLRDRTLFVFPAPPFFPPTPLRPVLKIHMAPTVYSKHTATILILSVLPHAFSPHPCHPPPPRISKFLLITIRKANPPNSSFRCGLTFSPLAKRTIGKANALLIAVLDPGAYFLSSSI